MGSTGLLDLENGSTLDITGNATNTGNIYTSYLAGTGGNTIDISGMLNNESASQFFLNGPGDKLIVGNGVSNGVLLTWRMAAHYKSPVILRTRELFLPIKMRRAATTA